jgi:hypothetical protein
MKIVIVIVLAGTLLSVPGRGQSVNTTHSRKENNVIPPGLHLSKGGIGIISTDLYIVVKSAKNELILKDGKRWAGKGAGIREVVLVFENRVWTSADVPPGFDLGKSIVVSFEGETIRFFEFDRKRGGYYERLRTE